MENNTHNESRKYWENTLSGEIRRIEFPYDYSKIEKGLYTKGKVTLDLSSEAFHGIKKLSKNSEIKMHMIFISVIDILLYKYTGYEDIIVASPIYKQKSKMNFINEILPFRNNISGEESFKEHLLKVKDSIVEAAKYQNFELEKLVNNIEVEKYKNEFSLFSVMCTMTNIHNINYESDKKANINFFIKNSEEKITVEAEYNAELYKEETVVSIMNCLEETLVVISEDAKIKIKDIDILSDKDRKKILYDFNSALITGDRDWFLDELFDIQAERNPENIALIDGAYSITYGELKEKVDRLATFLNENNISTKSVVGVMIDTSIDLIAAILGILKSGAAYLPIDSNYPPDRIKFMIEDSKLSVVLSEEKYKDNFDNNVTVIDIKDEEIYSSLNRSNKIIKRSVNDLAYIIYTSGTTGKPKGVMIEHKAVCKSLLWRKKEYNLNSTDSVIQLFSYSFDGFVTSFFTPIISGARVVLLKNQNVKNPYAIRDAIKENKVTHFISVPVLFKAILDVMSCDDAKTLRIVTLAGDSTTRDIIEKAKEINENMELVNEYGPTESSVVATVYRNLNTNSDVLIGKPIDYTEIYIVDNNNKLCPIGIGGELCISGPRLARGYLNREDITKQKFIDNPFEQGKTMYKTGDLAKWNSDGNIKLIGRIDNQIKLRGFRVELDEIENKILAYKDVKNAIVIAGEGENGDKYICAYYVSDIQIPVNELREYLVKVLPTYMVPAYFTQIEKIPVTPNGKVDRKNLPKPQKSLITDYIAPKTELEKEISKVWEEALNISPIGINDNFFSIGGDSLKAIQVASKLLEKYKIEINDIYKYQTINELSKKLENNDETLEDKIKKIMTASNEELMVEDESDLEKEKDLYFKRIEKYKNMELEKSTDYKNILLVGSTGYVGSYLLREILTTLDSNVYVLVRGKNIEEAGERLIEKINFYFGKEFYSNYKNRIKILKGDVSDEFLGLDKKEYEDLSEEIDCIINSAAYVKHFGNYSDFYNVNVMGTKRLVEFSRYRKIKSYNHISTISIASGYIENKNKVVFTEFDSDKKQECENYYAKSKLEAERIAIEASEKYPTDIKIFRLGNVVFNSVDGRFQENIQENAFYKFIKSIINLKYIPNINSEVFDFTFVDEAAEVIIKLFNKKSLSGEILHIHNMNKVSPLQLGEYLKEKYTDLKIVSIQEFWKKIYENINNDNLRPYIDNICMYLGVNDNGKITEFTVLSDKTKIILQNIGFKWSRLDTNKINKMIDYCKIKQFL